MYLCIMVTGVRQKRICNPIIHIRSGAAPVRVPWVPGHPLNLDNGGQAPILRETFGAKKPNFLKDFKILFITSGTPSFIWRKKV